MSGFELDARLQADCHALGRLGACHVLLHRNAAVPWFIVVPETAAVELCDLDADERAALAFAVDAVSRFVRERFEVGKLNVAAIGNVVRQLHVHVVGRQPTDPCWPEPIWGRLGGTRTWDDAQVRAIASGLGVEPR